MTADLTTDDAEQLAQIIRSEAHGTKSNGR
jgi:hypothetical protein